jgi:hypothetical protein
MSITVNVLLGAVTAAWAGWLWYEFQTIQAGGAAMRFLAFLAKIFLFTIFLVVAILFITLTRPEKTPPPVEKGTLDSVDAAEIRRLLRELRDHAGREPEAAVSVAEKDEPGKPDPFRAFAEAEAKASRLEEAWNSLLEYLSRETGAARVSLQLYDSLRMTLRNAFAEGFDVLQSSSNDADRPSELVRKTGKRLYVTEIETHPELSRPNRPQYRRSSFIILPLVLAGGETAGTLSLTEKLGNAGVFTTDDLGAAETAIAVLCGRLSSPLKRPF